MKWVVVLAAIVLLLFVLKLRASSTPSTATAREYLRQGALWVDVR